MAQVSDLTLKHRLFMKAYRYRTYDWSPGATLKKPLAQSRVAAITTAAFYLAHQAAFDESMKGGDVSYREIPRDVDLKSLEIGHRSDAFDPRGLQADANLALPLERLEEMRRDGAIGSVNDRHFSFMGSITAPGRLTSHSVPEVVSALKTDVVDVVFLTPV